MCQMDRKLLSMVFVDKPPKQKVQDTETNNFMPK